MRKRSGRSTLERVVTVNAAVILVGAVLGTVLARSVPSLNSALLIAVLFVFVSAVMILANYLVLHSAFRPLIELSRAMASITRAGGEQQLPSDAPDPDFRTVSQAVSEMLERIAGESRAYSAKVFESIEDERRRIGRELHDETSQSLAAALLNLDMAERVLSGHEQDAKARLGDAREIIHHCLAQLRLLVYDLRPSMLDDFGLVPALRWYVQTHLQASGLRVVSDIDSIDGRLPRQIETALYRISQESLANVVKHSGATRVVLHLTATPDHVSLTVSDNGVGFDAQEVIRNREHQDGVGLLSMRERASALDGTVTVYSVRDRGTQVQVLLPLGPNDLQPLADAKPRPQSIERVEAT